MSVTVRVGQESYVVTKGQEFTFGRSEQCSLCLAADDAAISRRAGMIVAEGGTWLVVNLSGTRPLDVVDGHGLRSTLAPLRAYALDGRMRVLVRGSLPKPHMLHISAPHRWARLVEAPTDEECTAIGQNVRISQQDRVGLVALFAGYLEDEDRYDPHPRSYEAAAKRLGCPRTTLVRRVEYLRSRLDKAGVPNMTGPNALNNLAEYVLTSGLITSDDLRALPGR
jgi:hypothetical protein